MPNPKGIPSLSPGLRAPCYPGVVTPGRLPTLQRLHQPPSQFILAPMLQCPPRINGPLNMPIAHIARTGKPYYLHVGPGKGGKANYYFSTDAEGARVEAVPDGFEIYENIRGQVFLRRKPPQVILDEELALATRALQAPAKGNFYRAEVKKNTIVIYEAEDKTEYYHSIALPWVSEAKLREGSLRSANFQAVMRFQLADRERRLFSAERYCFRGAVDDWIPISLDAAPLPALLKNFIKHLGKDSFFDLY
jgi:hypothetical protein